jgi:hypothetical protein
MSPLAFWPVAGSLSVVASCDTDGVVVTYTNTYNSASGNYEVTSVVIGGIDAACNGKTLAITLADSLKFAKGTGGAVVSGISQTFAITGNSDADVVANAAIVIAG